MRKKCKTSDAFVEVGHPAFPQHIFRDYKAKNCKTFDACVEVGHPAFPQHIFRDYKARNCTTFDALSHIYTTTVLQRYKSSGHNLPHITSIILYNLFN